MEGPDPKPAHHLNSPYLWIVISISVPISVKSLLHVNNSNKYLWRNRDLNLSD